jgi:type IV fimbrial biogenesis protein FimT
MGIPAVLARADVSTPPSTLHSAEGFTLAELVTIVIVAVLVAAIAVPALSDAMTSQRIRTSESELASALVAARSEAIKRNAAVQVKPRIGGDWASGWTVSLLATGERYQTKEPLGDRVAVRGLPASLTYQGNGRLASAGMTRITLADIYGHAPSRCILVDASGVPTLSSANTGC